LDKSILFRIAVRKNVGTFVIKTGQNSGSGMSPTGFLKPAPTSDPATLYEFDVSITLKQG
jgi:hypothetical protein